MSQRQIAQLLLQLRKPQHRVIKKRTVPRTPKHGRGVLDGLTSWMREPVAETLNQVSVQGLPKYSSDTLQKFGNERIVNWQLERTPIPGVINRLVTFVQKGKITQEPQDTFFHLYSVLTLESGQRLVVEKNETINIQGYDDTQAHRDQRNGAEIFSLSAPPNGFTLLSAVQNEQQAMGDRFFPYDALRNNCQDFQLAFLGSNGMLTGEAQRFIKQDTSEIIQNMPTLMELGAKAGTTLANWMTNAREFVGLGRQTRRKRHSRYLQSIL